MKQSNSSMKLINKQKQLKRPLILDGAMGTLLQQEGVKSDKYLWASIANISAPELVTDIHKNYIVAGADIITTNTFRTNPAAVKYSNIKFSIEELVKQSVLLAKNAAKFLDVFIAGSNAPAEDCYQKEVTLSKNEIEYNHKKHIELLWENGVDFILNETQSHLEEIEIICKYCSDNDINYFVSIFFDDELKLLSGEPLTEAIELIKNYRPIAIGFNCIKPSTFEKAYSFIEESYRWGFYLNCGSGSYTDEIIACGITPNNYIDDISNYLNKNPFFIGSCCGSTPQHTKALRKFFDEYHKN